MIIFSSEKLAKNLKKHHIQACSAPNLSAGAVFLGFFRFFDPD
jgi:hypothetical protein